MINVFQVIPPHVASQLYYHFIISSIFIVFTLSNLSFEAMKSAVAYRPSKVPSWKRRQVHQQKSWVPKNESSIHQFPSTFLMMICFNPFLISTWRFDVFQSGFFVVEGCWCKIEHHTSIFGFCAAASPKCPYKKKVQRLSNYKLEIWKQHRSLSSKLPVTMSGWVPHCKTSRCQHWCTWTNGWAQWHLKSLQKLHIAIEIGWNPKLVNQKMTQKSWRFGKTSEIQ